MFFNYIFGKLASIMTINMHHTIVTIYRGVTRLDGAQGKKQIWRPMFERKVFRKQMHLVGFFGAPRSHSGSPAVIRRPHSDSAFLAPWLRR